MEEIHMAETSKLNDMNKTSLDSIRTMLDANTIVGDPINTANGTTVIPISKISVAYASGGVDYHKKDAPANASHGASNFGGGGGTGVTVTPVGFLVITPEGGVSMLNVNSPTSAPAADPVSSVVGLIERSPELIEKIKGAIGKKEDDNQI